MTTPQSASLTQGSLNRLAVALIRPAVDVGLDVPDVLRCLPVLLDQTLHLLQGVDDGGVIPVSEFISDFRKRGTCQFPAQIHGDLPRVRDILFPPGGIHVLHIDVVFGADGVFYEWNIHGSFFYIKRLTEDIGGLFHCDWAVHQVDVGSDPVESAFQLTDVGCDVFRDDVDDTVVYKDIVHGGFVFQDSDPGFKVRRLNVDGKTPFETAFQSLIDGGDVLRWTVAGEHNLAVGFVQFVEGVEKLLLRAFLFFDELDVVDHQDVCVSVFFTEF